MNESTATALTEAELSLTGPAQGKMAELVGQVEEEIKGVRIYAAPGGCSGVSFGMTLTDQIDGDDRVLEYDSFNVIVDNDAMQHLRLLSGGRLPLIAVFCSP